MKSRTMLCWFVAAFVVTCGRSEATSQTDFWQKTNPPFGRTVSSVASNASSDIFAGTDAGVFRSTDNGETWTESNSGLDPDVAYSVFTSSGTIFAWGNTGYYRSTDNGSSWVNTGFPTVYYPVNALAISAAGHIFAGTSSDGVFHSTDNGAHWIPSNAGMRNSFVTRLAINSSDHIFAGTFSEGVYRSTDDGANWTPVNSGLTNDTVGSIVINASGTIFAETQGGLFRSVQSTTQFTTPVRELSADAPISFSLSQNYPNPFNPSTTIRYGLPHKSAVQLTVVNTLGQQVATLVNGEQEAGYHEIKFDGSGLSSGVYFYRIEAGSFVQTRKFVLLK